MRATHVTRLSIGYRVNVVNKLGRTFEVMVFAPPSGKWAGVVYETSGAHEGTCPPMRIGKEVKRLAIEAVST